MKTKAQSAGLKSQARGLACIILAAGKGTRMKSSVAKVMHKLACKPMLFHVIDTAKSLNAEATVLVTSPGMETVRDAVKKRYKDAVQHAVQAEARGTGDAVKSALPPLKACSGTVLVLYGDTPLIRPKTLEAMLAMLRDEPQLALVVLGMNVTPPNAYGKLCVNADGLLTRIVEEREATAEERAITLCNSGVMAVRGPHLKELIAQITNANSKGEYYLTDLVAHANAAGLACRVLPADAAELLGVNSRVELAVAEETVQERLRVLAMENGATLIAPATVTFAHDTQLAHDVTIHPHVVFGERVEIASNVEIRSFCHIEDAKVGFGAVIGPFARLRPGADIGDSAHVGNFVEIKNSVVERGAKINHLTYIGDASIGENSNIGAGTITCNYDGFEKHRTAIGARVFIGSNSSLVAPVSIGDGAMIGAGSVVTEDVESDALAIARAPQKQKPAWAKSFRNRKHN